MFIKFFISFLIVLSTFFSSSNVSAQPQFVIAKHLMFTSHGIIVNIDGHMVVTNSAVHVGHGVYEINDEYYGTCIRCEWPLSQDGRCTNLNCNQYISRQDMSINDLP